MASVTSAIVGGVLLVASAGCSSSGAPAGSVGSAANGVVVGPADTHCMGHYRKADYDNCFNTRDTSGEAAGAGGAASPAGGASAGGALDCNFAHDSGYGDPMFNDSGDDDECKYHMTWSATPIAKNQPFTLTVTATNLLTGAPLDTIAAQVAGKPALSRIEPAIPCQPSHLAPTAAYEAAVEQIGPGQFTVGPFSLDASGRWVIRYHFYEECLNSTTTPHAHVSFFVDVP